MTPLSIQGLDVDILEDYKYPGVHADNKMDWVKNATALYRKSFLFSKAAEIFQHLSDNDQDFL